MKSLITALLIASLPMLVSSTVDAASLASGEKLEVKVDRQKVGEETAALWRRFGAWCAISEWHPAVKQCEETRDGDTVFRTLTLRNGVKVKEAARQDTDKLPLRHRREPAAGQELRGTVLHHPRRRRSPHHVVRNL